METCTRLQRLIAACCVLACVNFLCVSIPHDKVEESALLVPTTLASIPKPEMPPTVAGEWFHACGGTKEDVHIVKEVIFKRKQSLVSMEDPKCPSSQLWQFRPYNRSSYQLYTPSQTQECLHNQKILFMGDSHVRNLWRALLDVSTGGSSDNYYRWDYEDHPFNKTAHLPNTLYTRGNDHTKVGVPNACSLRANYREVLQNNTEAHFGDLWNCTSGYRLDRRKHDLREISVLPETTIHATWCASALREALGKTKCRDGPGTFANDGGLSLLESLGSDYDFIVTGFHAHDIKGANCNKKETNCRQRLSEELIANTKKFAEYVQAHSLPVVWATSGPMDLNDIPKQYHEFQQETDLQRERTEMVKILLDHNIPILDTYHMAQACRKQELPYCLSGDGMHSSRYVDRMRMHMLLNWKCG